MKKEMSVLVLVGSLMAGSVLPAQAINREWSAVAGFVGGYIVGSASYGRPAYYGHACAQPVVYQQRCAPQVNYQDRCAPQVVYPQSCAPQYIVQPQAPSGHFAYRQQQVWVPGRWVYQQIGCNQYVRSWQPGGFQCTTVRVWVPDCQTYASW